MTQAKKEITPHNDKLGQQLAVGDCVVFPSSNSLIVGTIMRFTPKMIRVQKVPASKWASEWNKYPVDVVKVDGPEVTMYLLANAK